MTKKLLFLITLLLAVYITPAFSYWVFVYANKADGTHEDGFNDTSFENLKNALRNGKSIRVYCDGPTAELMYNPLCVYYQKVLDYIAARMEFPWLEFPFTTKSKQRFCYLELRTNGSYILVYHDLMDPTNIITFSSKAALKWFIEEY